MKLLLVSVLVLSIVCLAVALFHWLRLVRDRNDGPQNTVTQRPLWLEFPRAYTSQGRHHQRHFFIYFVVFVFLLIGLCYSVAQTY